ncbi:MAG: cation:dicarboxylate symporter family transporter [Streptococcus salivarius]
MKRFISTWNRTSLIKRIAIGVVIGAVLGLLVPKFTVIGLLGDMFVGGLKAIAPLLVFALVANALSQTREGQQSNMKTVIVLYLFGTFAAALTAVISHYIFPISLIGSSAATKATAPQGVGEVFKDLLLKMVITLSMPWLKPTTLVF